MRGHAGIRHQHSWDADISVTINTGVLAIWSHSSLHCRTWRSLMTLRIEWCGSMWTHYGIQLGSIGSPSYSMWLTTIWTSMNGQHGMFWPCTTCQPLKYSRAWPIKLGCNSSWWKAAMTPKFVVSILVSFVVFWLILVVWLQPWPLWLVA